MRPGRSTTLAKSICLSVIHQVLLWLQTHALIAKALRQGDSGLNWASMLHPVDADGVGVALVVWRDAVHALKRVNVVGVIILVQHRVRLQLRHVLALDHLK